MGKANSRFLLAAGIVLSAAMIRLLPHPWNFTPIGAMALFGGARFQNKWLAVLFPLLALLLSDCLMQVLFVSGFFPHGGFYPGIAGVYASFVLVALVGMLIRNQTRIPAIGLASIPASVLFFTTTNFATWVWSGWYDQSWAGLVECFTLAIPFQTDSQAILNTVAKGEHFFLNLLVGDLFYTGVFFGAYAAVASKLGAERKTQAVAGS